MGLHNTRESWGWPAKALHWLTAIIVIGLLLVGVFMVNFIPTFVSDLNDATTLRVDLTQTHKSFGFVVFTLACLRVVWRWYSPNVPSLPHDTKTWQRRAVAVTHYGLYLLIFLMPLSGWLMSSASPLNDAGGYMPQIKNMVFGLFEMPDPFVPGDRELEIIFKTIHEYCGYALAFLLFLHIGGVMLHHFVLKDAVLTRMLPFGRDRSEPPSP